MDCKYESLGLVLANIVMTKYRRVTADKSIEDGIIKFYVRYIDNTLLVIKSFSSNLKFKINAFENCVPHFPHIKIFPNGLCIYQTGH